MTARTSYLRTLGAATLVLCGVAGAASAAELPRFQSVALKLTARGEDIRDFLRAMFDAAGINATISAGVQGKVNGRFAAPPAKLWADLARAFDLVGYYDGTSFFVYSRTELGSQTIAAVNPQAVVEEVRRLGLLDRNHRINAAPMKIDANGTPGFLATVARLAGTIGAVRDIDAAERPPIRIAAADRAKRDLRSAAATRANPTGAHETRIYYLRYARADDSQLDTGGTPIVIKGLASVLRDIMGAGGPVGSAVSTRYGADRGPNQPRRLDPLVQRPQGPADQDADYVGVRDGASEAGQADTGRVGGRPSIATVKALNAIVVRDLPENMATYDGLIRALDVEPRIVEIEATIIDIDLDRVRELGIDWRIQSQGFGALLGSDVVQRTGDPRVDSTLSATPNRGLILRGAIGPNNELVARFQALEQRGAAHIVSKPRLVTLSDTEAAFDRTRTFNVRVPGNRQSDLFSVSAGTTLRVNPHVLADGGAPRIRLSVVIEDGSIEGVAVDNIPIVERARVATETLIGEGESLLLGGLTVDSRLDALNQVPGLGDVPVLGNLFKTRRKERRRIERLFLITPRVGSLDNSVPVTKALATMPVPAAPGAGDQFLLSGGDLPKISAAAEPSARSTIAALADEPVIRRKAARPSPVRPPLRAASQSETLQ